MQVHNTIKTQLEDEPAWREYNIFQTNEKDRKTEESQKKKNTRNTQKRSCSTF